MIDPHVHLRDWNQIDSECILHAMRVASRLGFTHLFDMPNTSPPCTNRTTILRRLEDGRKAEDKTGLSYHLYLGLTSDENQVKEMVEIHSTLFPRVIGLKMFACNSTGNMGISGVENQRKVFQALKGYKGVLAVHAEKDDFFHPELFDIKNFETHSDVRPAIAETESVKDLVMLALETGFEGTLHICHVSAKNTIEYVASVRDKLKITMGSTPHHALLSRSAASDNTRLLTMNPPLRSEEDRIAVFNGLLDGTIDWAESDHAPHTLEAKRKPASGVPALPGMLILLSKLKEAGCSEERLKDLFGRHVMKAFGLKEEDVVIPADPMSLYLNERKEYNIDPYGFLVQRR